ncbi:MAG: HD domain-containing phosphohydrolase [Desulfotomaculales bacterium]
MALESGKRDDPGTRGVPGPERMVRSCRALGAIQDLDETLDLVLEEAMTVVGAEAGTLWFWDDEERVLRARVVRGPVAQKLRGLSLAVGEGLAGTVLASGRPLLVRDARQDPRWAGRFDAATGFVTRSLLVLPLHGRDGPVGVLQFVNKTDGGFFEPADLEVGLAFAGPAAVAIENSRLFDDRRRLLVSGLRTLAAALDARDPYTRGHSERVTAYALRLAEALGLPRGERELLERAGLLHDIGKIGIRDAVLLQPGPLDEEAWEQMRRHPVIGAEIVAQMEPRRLTEPVRLAVLHHHERWDGSGYPAGLAGEEIPLLARVIALADAFDAMTSDRPYRRALGREEALAEIRKNAGRQFDPELAAAFVRVMGD